MKSIGQNTRFLDFEDRELSALPFGERRDQGVMESRLMRLRRCAVCRTLAFVIFIGVSRILLASEHPSPAPAQKTMSAAGHETGKTGVAGIVSDFAKRQPSLDTNDIADPNHLASNALIARSKEVEMNGELLTRFVTSNKSNLKMPLPATNAAAGASAESGDNEVSANSDLLPNNAKKDHGKQYLLQDWLNQLEAARQCRRKREYYQAIVTLVRIMESTAPEEVKRPCLLELAYVAQQDNHLVRAQQIFSQYTTKYPEDPLNSEILLRQGILYRQMGSSTLALSKFYAVLSSSLTMKSERFAYYQRLVLQAQTEIADTYFLLGKYEESADFFNRLLRLDTQELNKPRIQYKLVRALNYLGRWEEATAQARDYLTRYAESVDEPEVRFLLALALKQLGRNNESTREVAALLASQSRTAAQNPENWVYWQQRTGNEIANQLYKEGDYVSALNIYQNLAKLDNTAAWQFPVYYQIGLVYERLKQPEKAVETYGQIVSREKELGTNASPTLHTVVDMSKWRKDFLQWETKTTQKMPDILPNVYLAIPPNTPVKNETAVVTKP